MTSNIHDLIDQIQGQLPGRWRVPGRDFYERETTAVTKDILGCLLVRQIASPSQSAPLTLGGRIVEAEAYLGEHDPAAHASRGRTLATDVMYRAGGHAYVYKIYGMYYCLNATAEPPGTPGCVLIRAIEPIFGIDAMLARRGLEAEKIRNLGSGPGKLCQALGIDRGLNGADLTAGPLLILRPEEKPSEIVYSGPRVGITRAADWPLRFWIAGSPWVSRAPNQ